MNTALSRFLGMALLLLVVGVAAWVYSDKKENQLVEEPSGQEVTQEPTSDPEPVTGGEITLEGEYVCLQPKVVTPGSVRDGNCQLGIKADDGYYYSLDFNVINPALELGDRFGVTGTFVPIETLSSNFLRDNYDVRGVIIVESLDVT